MLAILLQFIHILSLVCWLGAIVFFSFFAAPAIFKTLDRETAGKLVGVIFPRYYFISYVCSVLLLATLLLGAAQVSGLKLGAILVMIAGSWTAGLIVSPKARKLKAAIHSAANDDERQSHETAFKKLHSYAVKLNAMVLLAGLWLLWLTAAGLKL